MAAFLRRPRILIGPALGTLRSGSDQPRSMGGLFAGSLSRSPEAVRGWRGGGGVSFSSWTGGAGTWRYQSYQRPLLARWGDWACLGLTALAGGLFWTPSTQREMPLTERLLHLVLMYGALKYSLKRKLLRLRLKWFRLKLVLKGVIFQELEREYQACLDEVNSILQDLEDAVSYKMENVTKKAPIEGRDPILMAASILLLRIEKLKKFISRKPKGPNRSSPQMDFDSMRTEFLVDQLSRLEMLVKGVVRSHVVNKVCIIRNKELVAKVDNMLLNLDKEK